ncbi:hypothetical protein L2E82_07271 [Cichorium intybus]|uniref:Uncharacterized protein n=1 Tax=Cichorium intybus TaxID=13427 RepID=A0ACB9G3T3_CICIN|nr:hypothetical protein L2E82_07271 [Cichorium intybus]
MQRNRARRCCEVLSHTGMNPQMALDVKLLHKGEDLFIVCKPESVPVTRTDPISLIGSLSVNLYLFFLFDAFLLYSGVRLLLVLFLGFAQCEKDFSFPPLKAIWVSTFTSKF